MAAILLAQTGVKQTFLVVKLATALQRLLTVEDLAISVDLKRHLQQKSYVMEYARRHQSVMKIVGAAEMWYVLQMSPAYSEHAQDLRLHYLKCPIGTTCVLGSCACSPPEVLCSGVCTNIPTDPKNCDGCGQVVSRVRQIQVKFKC